MRTSGVKHWGVRFLTEEQVLVLQTINGLRDAAQHHLLEISEEQLYLHVQSGVTLFRDLLSSVFGKELAAQVPPRVLPVSTAPPTSLVALFDRETEKIRSLLRPGRRQGVAARAAIRPLAILDATLRGEKSQPSEGELLRIGRELWSGKHWSEVFPGVAAIDISAEGKGLEVSLRFSNKQGVPVQVVPEGTPGASVVAVKRVNELDFYSLGAKQLASKVGLTTPKLVALVDHIELRKNNECYKEIVVGKTVHKRYSPKAIERIMSVLNEGVDPEMVWQQRRALKK